jgi:RsiW-degrading membrane proteinase PrsW (M82 family)
MGMAERGFRYLMIAFLAGLFLICTVIVLAVTGAAMSPQALILATIASVLPVPMYAGFILWLDRHEKEPATALLVAFFWGAIVAVAFAAIFNQVGAMIIYQALGEVAASVLTLSVVAPVVEETAKGMALLLLFFWMRHEFNNVVDGIAYGALIGLGFAMSENVLYLGRGYVQGGIGALTMLFVMRVVMVGFMHSLWTGCTGAALGAAREIRPGLWRFVVPVAGYLSAIALHLLWNSSNIIVMVAAHAAGLQPNPITMILVMIPIIILLLLPGVVVLIALAAAGWKREIRIINEQLGQEASQGVTVTPAELQVLTNWRERSRRLKAARRTGRGALVALRQLYELQVDFAFRKWHASRGERLKPHQLTMTEDGYRERIASVRERLKAAGVATS